MPNPEDLDVTGLLHRWQGGDAAALGELVELVHSDLRRVAHGQLRRERTDHTLQTNALINEAYLRLVDQRRANWNSRIHFFAVAAQIMRRILVDYARARGYAKRGGGAVRVPLDPDGVPAPEVSSELLALDDALTRLAAEDERKARVVELQYFAGMTADEIASALGMAPSTVRRDLTFARAWLRRTLDHGE